MHPNSSVKRKHEMLVRLDIQLITCRILCRFNILILKEFIMTKFSTAAKTLALVTSLTLTGCATNADLAKVADSAANAQATANSAMQKAEAAQSSADNALSRANAAQSSADQALSTANAANQKAEQAKETANRMFKKAMMK